MKTRFRRDILWASVLCLTGLICMTAVALAEIGDGDNVSLVGRLAFGRCNTAIARADTLFLGNGCTLQIVDFATPATPLLIGEYTLMSNVEAIAVYGNHVYVMTHSEGIAVIGISDPTAPTLVLGAIGGSGYGLHIEDDLLYTAIGYDMGIYDISVPSAPVVLGSYPSPDWSYDVDVADGIAYIASGSDGLRIVNVGDPSAPVEVGHHDTPGHAFHVAIDGQHAYVCDQSEGVRIIDVSNPAAPTEVAFWEPMHYNAYRAAVRDDLLYLAAGSYGLAILDITDPSAPTELGRLDTNDSCFDVALVGNLAYVADQEHGLAAIDITVPSAMVELGRHWTGGSAHGIVVVGDIVWQAEYRGGFRAIDISDPTEPVTLSFTDTPAYAERIVVRGDHAYIGGAHDGLLIYDITDPTNPSHLGEYGNGYTRGIDLVGDLAYMTAGASGLAIVDISNPANPSEVAVFDTPDFTWAVDVVGNHAYVADATGGLRVIDVSTPSSPTEIGVFDTDIRAIWVEVRSNLAYVCDDYGDVRIFDISIPANPTEVGSAEANKPYGLAFAGNYLYVACGWPEVQIFDLTDPAQPTVAGYFETGDYAFDIAADGRNLYVAAGAQGMWILENELITPVYLVSFTAERSRTVDSGTAAAAHRRPAVLRWEITGQRTGVAFHVWRQEPGSTRERLTGLAVTGTNHFEFVDASAPAGEAEYWLQEVRSPGGNFWFGPARLTADGAAVAFRLAPAVPNPFNPSTEFAFTLRQPGWVRLTVHDARGRAVASLVEGFMGAGEHPVGWGGRDDGGRAVASGTYFARLETEHGLVTGKLLLAR